MLEKTMSLMNASINDVTPIAIFANLAIFSISSFFLNLAKTNTGSKTTIRTDPNAAINPKKAPNAITVK